MSDNIKTNYIWDGNTYYEILTTKLSRYINNDFTNFVIDRRDLSATPLNIYGDNHKTILISNSTNDLEKKYQMSSKKILVISENSAFTIWNRVKPKQIPTYFINNLMDLSIDDNESDTLSQPEKKRMKH
jgi:hypothetical protein